MKYSRDEVGLRDNVFVDGEMAYHKPYFNVYVWGGTRYKRHHRLYMDWFPENFNLRDLTALYYGMTTDQRFDAVHALDNDEIVTPNMDKLVSSGLSFIHAHIMGSMRSAVCMPSRA